MKMDELGLQFPCIYPVKAMGANTPEFAGLVYEIVARHAPDTQPDDCSVRLSKADRYASITCLVAARSREQLEALFTELNAHPLVVMTL